MARYIVELVNFAQASWLLLGNQLFLFKDSVSFLN